MWEGSLTIAQDLFVDKNMQQTAPIFKVHEIIEENKMLKELKEINPTPTFNRMNVDIAELEVWKFLDASFNIT